MTRAAAHDDDARFAGVVFFTLLCSTSCAPSTTVEATVAATVATTPTTVATTPTTVEAPLVRARACASDPAVVALLLDRPGEPLAFQCTATLIAPDVVLTAAHCVYEQVSRPEQILISSDGDVVDGERRVVGFWMPPGYPRSGTGARLDQRSNDVALLFLERPLSSIPPVYVATDDDDDALAVGDDLRLVGFGSDGEDDGGTKRCADTVLTDLGSALLVVGDSRSPSACFGDSGGPVFVDVGGELRVVGVNGFLFLECGAGAFAARVDSYRALLDDALRAACDDGTRQRCGDDPGLPAPAPQAPASGDGGCAAAPASFTPLALGLALAGRRRRAQMPRQRPLPSSSSSA